MIRVPSRRRGGEESGSAAAGLVQRGSGELRQPEDSEGRESLDWGPGPLQWILTGLTAVMLWAVVLLSLTEVLAFGFWLIRAFSIVAVAVLSATLVAALAPRALAAASWIGVAAGFACCTVWFIANGRSLDWWRAFGELFSEVGRRIVEESPALDVYGPLEDLLLLAVWAASVPVIIVMFRLRRPLLAAGLSAGFLLVSPAVTGVSSQWTFLLGAGLLLAALVWTRSPAPSRLGFVAALLAVAVAAGVMQILPATRDRIWNTSLLPAPVSSSVPDVTIQLADDLRERSNARAFSFTSSRSGAHRFTLATLSDFEGGRWLPQDTIDEHGLDVRTARSTASLPPEEAELPDAQLTRVTITIEGLLSSWLPLPQSPLRVRETDGDGDFDPAAWKWMRDSNTAAAEREITRRGDRYTVDSQPLSASALPYYDVYNSQPRLVGPDVADDELARYLALPDGLPELISQTAQLAAGNATDRMSVGRMLQLWFQSGDFAYDESAPYTPGRDPDDPYAVMEALLTERSGFCVHYATTFAVMARSLGVPSRVAVGYAARSKEESTPVRGRDLHAWPEIYLDDIGWVAFEPTPGGAGVRAETGEDVPPTPETTPDDQVALPAPPPGDAPPVDALGLEEFPGMDGAAGADGGVPVALPVTAWTVAALVLAALLLPLSVRSYRRMCRRRSAARGILPAVMAWEELRDTAVDLRLLAADANGPPGSGGTAEPYPRARTAEALLDHLAERGVLAGEAEAAARRLAEAMSAERYSGGRVDAGDVDVSALLRRAVRQLRSASSAGARIRAFWLPSSVRLHRR